MTSPHDRRPSAPRRRLLADLASFGDRTAIVTIDAELSYHALAARVADAADRLGDQRRLVLLAALNHVEAVVAYLGALAGGHVVLMAPGDKPDVIESLAAAYQPDVLVRPVDGAWRYEERRAGSAHHLHPELALLLSTSGSTGSPKLVRLSHENLRSNAESIAEYLDIRGTDRAATTLPMYYCYGLSVINSHLVRGAGLILTELSVADAHFWELFRRAGGTSFAGVPYTFTLLDRVGFEDLRLPDLRYVTQAGGRLAPERVRHYAEMGRRQGWDLFVMYGQTEATARMAYLPPERAATHPAAIGVAIPGGALRLELLDGDPQVGELVYAGPNVMLGYAERPADLGLGRTVRELRTGDLARCDSGGLFEIVGRRSRFVKVFGLRIDLQRVEAGLEADGVTACCVARDDELVTVVEAAGYRRHLDRLVAARCGLPGRAVRIVVLPELPRLASGKVDHAAVAEIAGPGSPAAPAAATDPRALYAEVLDRPDVSEDSTFVGLGGDSLSYVALSVRLEQLFGGLPAAWHTMPIRELRLAVPAGGRPRVRRWRTVDTAVVLRAVSIVLIVGTHAEVFTIRGGAHLLLAVAGFNFARFHLTDVDRRRRARHLARSVARIAVPTSVYLALVVVLLGDYGWENVFLLNEMFGPRTGDQRHYWYLETLVYIMLTLLVVLSVRAVDRWERRLPFVLPLALLAGALTIRYDVISLSPMDNFTTPAALFWLFALGWAAGKATTWAQRLLVAAIGVLSCVGYFSTSVRQAVVTAGLLLLILVPRLPGTRLTNRLLGVLAGSSLYIYLTHWQVYPLLADRSGLLALIAALAAGVLFGKIVEWVAGRPVRLRRRSVPPAADTAPRTPGHAMARTRIAPAWQVRLGSTNFKAAGQRPGRRR